MCPAACSQSSVTDKVIVSDCSCVSVGGRVQSPALSPAWGVRHGGGRVPAPRGGPGAHPSPRAPLQAVRQQRFVRLPDGRQGSGGGSALRPQGQC